MNSSKKGPGRPKKGSNPYEKAPGKKTKTEDFDDEEDYGGDNNSDQSESYDGKSTNYALLKRCVDDFGYEGGNGKGSKGSSKTRGVERVLSNQ